ncbi:MAG: very short patch repair endonuclease [Nitrospinota bacterium]
MVDRFSSEKRSDIMSRIKLRDTKPEKLLRSQLHRMGFRFRNNVSYLPGKPDIVLPRYRKTIFMHGCFWHGHKGCGRAKRPVSNVNFWNRKIDNNIKRDKKVRKELKSLGWKSLVIWQCQINKMNTVTLRLRRFLS